MNSNNEPIEYVRGFTGFLECKIDLSKKPLIPRKETEFWVAKAINKIKEVSAKNTLSRDFSDGLKIKVLDMFAGSGCIGIAILKYVKNSEVIFVDNDKSCIAQIKINLKINNINKKRYKVIKSDVFDDFTRQKLAHLGGRSYNFVFANPPYIPTRPKGYPKNLVQKSVLKYEPHRALFGGEDGMRYIKKFLKQAKNHLNPAGQIFMEFDSPQKKKIEKLSKNCGYKNCQFYKDQYGKYRWVVIG